MKTIVEMPKYYFKCNNLSNDDITVSHRVNNVRVGYGLDDVIIYDEISCVISLCCYHSQVTPRTTHSNRSHFAYEKLILTEKNRWEGKNLKHSLLLLAVSIDNFLLRCST